MTLEDYLRVCATKLQEAQAKGDRPEIIRLCQLVKDTCDDTIRKVEAAQ